MALLTERDIIAEARKQTNRSKYDLKRELKILYKQLSDELQKYIGSGGAFFSMIRLSAACVAADANVTQEEYELFKEISGTGPTYYEFNETAATVDRDYKGALQGIMKYGKEATVLMIGFVTRMIGYKGYLNKYDEDLIWLITKL